MQSERSSPEGGAASEGPGLDAGACRDFARSSRVEWLETNGLGGFAMGTAAGVNTRRYHGLLVASLRPPVDRAVLLSRLDETLVPAGGGRPVELATNQYPGAVSPAGYRNLMSFRLAPFPTWEYQVGGLRLSKQLFLVQGEQTVVALYTADRPVTLRVNPFLAFRDYHALQRRNGELNGSVRTEQVGSALALRVRPYAGLPELALWAPRGSTFEPDGGWYLHTEYLSELERGLDFREDLWKMGTLTLEVTPSQPAFVVASLEPRAFDAEVVRQQRQNELSRRRPRGEGAPADPLAQRLWSAADAYGVRRADGKPTVIAGYPWFTDWGRDTMIALPGLLIARGRLNEARDVLRGFLQHLDHGILPNRFPDRPGEQPEYNTVDATLWLFEAVAAWAEAGGSRAFVRDEVFPAAQEILSWHELGTHHGIRVDPQDGLLAAGEPGVQLTWMDARVGDWVVTPRHGKPVEINALYHNALRIAAGWAQQAGEETWADRYTHQADRVAASFEERFWNPARGCLFDVVGPGGPDARLRPNQLFAVSLRHPLLTPARRQAVVRAVERELLTPYGLRTLSPSDTGYTGRYRGGVAERDGAYHQGTVWPWLLGPYVRAFLRAFGRTAENVAHCRALLAPLAAHLDEACLGQVSEVFDGDAPHRPGGAPAQAWSVAEPLAVLLGELAAASPPAPSEPRP